MPLAPDTRLSRFVFTSKYMRRDNSIKWQAFKPKNNEVSVYQTDNISEDNIWSIGREVESQSGRSLQGRADIYASAVFDVNLSVVESVPPPRHANIIGWPPDEADMKQIAMELSEASQGYRL